MNESPRAAQRGIRKPKDRSKTDPGTWLGSWVPAVLAGCSGASQQVEGSGRVAPRHRNACRPGSQLSPGLPLRVGPALLCRAGSAGEDRPPGALGLLTRRGQRKPEEARGRQSRGWGRGPPGGSGGRAAGGRRKAGLEEHTQLRAPGPLMGGGEEKRLWRRETTRESEFCRGDGREEMLQR